MGVGLGDGLGVAVYRAAVDYLEASAAEEGTVNISTPLDMARYQLAVINDTLISPWVSRSA